MKRRLFHLLLAALSGLALALALLWLGAASPVRADPNVHCANQTGMGCDAVCEGGCYSSVQAAVDAATGGQQIRVADGTYGPAGGPVAVITKELQIQGGYDSSCGTHDPDTYETVLDAQWGGSVVSITNATDVTLLNLTLTRGDGTGNDCLSASGCGGGIYATGTSLHVGGCVITNNVGSTAGAWKADGGGIYAYASNYVVEIWDSHILSNVANTDPSAVSYSYGGGIYVHYGTASLRNNQVINNVGSMTGTGGYGGGIFLYAVTPADVLTNTVRGNKASVGSSTGSGSGGGLSLFGGNVYLAANRVENNWTNPNQAGYGGGVYIWSNAKAHLSRNTIISNATVPQSSGFWAPGGGVCINSSEPVTLSNNLIVSNTASSGAGGGVYAASFSSPAVPTLLVNNTIADNGNSGLVVGQYVDLTMINNIIAGHTVGVTNTSPANSSVSADSNLFWNTSDPIVGSNAVQQNPLLLPNHHLDDGSPAINKGVFTWADTDIDGDVRPDWCFFDIGADEYITGQGCKNIYLPLAVRNYP